MNPLAFALNNAGLVPVYDALLSPGNDITNLFASPAVATPEVEQPLRLPDPSYKAPSGMDIIRHGLRLAGHAVSGGLPVAGGMAEGPLGVGAGTATADFLKSLSPEYFGDPPKDAGDIALDVGGNVAMDTGFGLAHKYASQLPRGALLTSGAAGAITGDQLLSDENSTPGERVGNAMIGGTLATGASGLTRAGYNRVARPRLKANATSIAEGMNDAGGPLTLANISDNPMLQRLTTTLAPETASRTFNAQESATKGRLFKDIPDAQFGPEHIGEGIHVQIGAGDTTSRNIKNAAWSKLNTNIQKVKQHPLIGAILGQTGVAASNTIEDIFRKSVPGFSNAKVRQAMIGLDKNYEALFDTMNQIRQAANDPTGAADPQLLQNLKSIVGDIGYGEGTKHPTKVQFQFRQLAQSLKEDISAEYGRVDEAVRGARKDATLKLAEARKRDPQGVYTLNDFLPKELHGTSKFSLERDYNEALGKSEQYAKTYGKRDASGTFKTLTAEETANTPKENLTRVIQDADKIDSTIKASGSPEVTRGLLGQQYLADIFDESFKGDKGSQMSTLIDRLKNTSEQGKLTKLFTPEKRKQLEDLGNAMQSIPKADAGSWQSASNAMRITGGALALGVSAASLGLSDDPKMKMGGLASVGLGIGGALLARKALLSDGFAKMVMRNAGKKITQLSAGDSAILMQALRGEEVFLMTPSGKKQGKIDDDGKFVENTKK